jgi:endogenous inhibitor of DNA gyrase (YacG/DUF329 family)
MTTPAPAEPADDRHCTNCGRRLHVPARAPGKRFCSPRCRVADWHRRNDRRNKEAEPPANIVPEPGSAVNAVPAAAPATSRCPHCGQRVAVISVLVTPAAAHVPVPAPPDRQQP